MLRTQRQSCTATPVCATPLSTQFSDWPATSEQQVVDGDTARSPIGLGGDQGCWYAPVEKSPAILGNDSRVLSLRLGALRGL